MAAPPDIEVQAFPDDRLPPSPRKGRAATANPDPRFDAHRRQQTDDGWRRGDEESPAPRTVVLRDATKSIIVRNDSPDVPFDRSINPYRGCEHGCIYCFARPTHAYLGLSPGLDFETKIVVKYGAARLLRQELARPGYRCEPIAFGTNTDCYQPLERRLGIMRGILEVLAECRHPLSIVTKSALVERDLGLLADMARDQLVHVIVSVTSLDAALSRRLEPRAAQPARRLETIRRLAAAGVPAGVFVAPLIPALNDHELESILAAAREAGAQTAGFIPVRLPLEVAPLFEAWLREHAPGRADHVLSLIRQMRGGKLNDPRFGARMRGSGHYADMVRQRFHAACRRLGLNRRDVALDCSRFAPPRPETAQLDLF